MCCQEQVDSSGRDRRDWCIQGYASIKDNHCCMGRHDCRVVCSCKHRRVRRRCTDQLRRVCRDAHRHSCNGICQFSSMIEVHHLCMFEDDGSIEGLLRQLWFVCRFLEFLLWFVWNSSQWKEYLLLLLRWESQSNLGAFQTYRGREWLIVFQWFL